MTGNRPEKVRLMVGHKKVVDYIGIIGVTTIGVTTIGVTPYRRRVVGVTSIGVSTLPPIGDTEKSFWLLRESNLGLSVMSRPP